MESTASLIDRKMKEGKCKMGVCEFTSCTNKEEELLYRVQNKFVCGKCVDEIGNMMEKLGMI